MTLYDQHMEQSKALVMRGLMVNYFHISSLMGKSVSHLLDSYTNPCRAQVAP